MKKRKLLLLGIMFFSSITFAGIYKWKNDKGNIHYSDTPPTDRKFEKIEVPLQTSPPPLETEKKTQYKEDTQEAIDAFIAEISNQISGFRARDTQDAQELYRWGKGICDFFKSGMSERELIEDNMDQFWGKELGTAIVKAAHKVICPEIK
jgi:hypothetical protein